MNPERPSAGETASEGSRQRPVIVSRRWDSLGARLSAMAGAAGLAERLGCDFGFEWPSRASTIDYPASLLLSDEFCDRHLVRPMDQSGETEPNTWRWASMSRSEVQSLIDAERSATVRFDDPYVRPVFADDTLDEAIRRFSRGAARLDFSDRAAAIRAAARTAVDGIELAVHARFGDLVTGPWRRFVAREKFRPRPLIEAAIDATTAPGSAVLVVSDSPEVVSDLGRRRAGVVTLGELMPGYEELDEIARSWADLFALSAIGRILAPSSSAFSGFAAAAAGQPPMDVLARVPADERVPKMRVACLDLDEPESRFARCVTSREICYLLDSDSGELDGAERHRLSRLASEVDPGHSEAASRLALSAVALGRFEEASDALQRAEVEARRAQEVHHDPLMDVLGASLIVAVIAGACRRDISVPPVESLLEEMRTLSTYQLPRSDLIRAGEHLARSGDCLDRPTRWAARRARRRLDDLGPRGSASWSRPDVWRDLEYSAILAAVERVAFWLGSLATPHPERRVDADFRVVSPSANDVVWVECTTASRPDLPGLIVMRGDDRVIASGPLAGDHPEGQLVVEVPLARGMVGPGDAESALRDLVVVESRV